MDLLLEGLGSRLQRRVNHAVRLDLYISEAGDGDCGVADSDGCGSDRRVGRPAADELDKEDLDDNLAAARRDGEFGVLEEATRVEVGAPLIEAQIVGITPCFARRCG